MRRAKTPSRSLDVALRRAYVFGLRRTGATYASIYATISTSARWRGRLPKSYDARHVHADVLAELTRLQTELADDVDAVRTQELDRLDHLLLGLWPRASQGDTSAVQAVLTVMARRARMLPGLEVPAQIAATVDAGEGMAALLRDLASASAP